MELREQIEELRKMTVVQLREKYREVFGEESRSNHKQFLFRRIAWRIQALSEGSLSERARRRAMEIANDADLRIQAPKGFDVDIPSACRVSRKVAVSDPRLPPPGQMLVRQFKDKSIIVKVRTDGFEYENRIYRALSAIAREVTGTKWNGFLFFNVAQTDGAKHEKR